MKQRKQKEVWFQTDSMQMMSFFTPFIIINSYCSVLFLNVVT